MSLIALKGVTKIFNRGRPDEFTALSDVSLEIEPRGLVVFKGPSGSGKTTLLAIVGCMAKPTAGRVFVQDREVTSLPDRFLTDIRRHTFGFIFQQLHLVRGVSALENVILPAYPSGERLAPCARGGCGCSISWGLPTGRTRTSSGSPAGRPSAWPSPARSINEPAIVIADEPTAHLDTKLSLDFMAAMERLKAEGKTILFASHDPLVYESAMVDRVLEMRDGRIVAERRAS